MGDNANDPQSSEIEMLDVVVTLEVSRPTEVAQAVRDLQAAGMKVARVDDSNGVVEGTITAQEFGDLRKVQRVRHVRRRFEYMAE